ncbi:MAG TPA: rhombotarget lipoprotein [Opitutus sp.]|nr:rhombotarget lipoprotein [Opitutus sp.]
MLPLRLPVCVLVAFATFAALFGSGCTVFNRERTDRSSSVVSFLYPNEANPLPPTTIPVLRLPLRVGVAFVPSSGGRGMSEAQKLALLERVAGEFRAYPFVQSIEVIPSTYLRAQGGFTNLDQVRTMLGIDVIALVAYDQVQFTDENFLSLSYWTIVGAYIFQGNKNDTQTMMEAAVYDIPSRHLLFRAPGISRVQANSQAMYLDKSLRDDSGHGFEVATGELIANLKTQLDAFRERVKNAPGEVQIEHKPGYTGGGAMDGVLVGLLALLGFGRWLWRRK